MKRDDHRHLSDAELVRAADGEPGRWSRRARVHLEACDACRTRAARFENTIAELARAQRDGLDASLPPITSSRALLRARIAETSAPEASFSSRIRFSGGWLAGALGVAALVAVAAVAGVLAFRHSGARSENPVQSTADAGVLPNRDFTPGVARPVSLQEICALPHEQVVKEVSPAQRRRVFEEYGIPSERSGEYEVDYLIAPGLGGEEDIRNLWPEPYHSATWNAHVKDALEERLHQMVCSDQLDLAVAQKAISTDWIAAYRKYVKAPPSAVDGGSEL